MLLMGQNYRVLSSLNIIMFSILSWNYNIKTIEQVSLNYDKQNIHQSPSKVQSLAKNLTTSRILGFELSHNSVNPQPTRQKKTLSPTPNLLLDLLEVPGSGRTGLHIQLHHQTAFLCGSFLGQESQQEM